MVLPKLSLVVGCYNMARELPRTIRSLSPNMQAGVSRSDYEIIVVDNGSTEPFDEDACRKCGADLRLLKFPVASPSPVKAINAGIEQARGDLVGMLIDGARLASPGIVSRAMLAASLADRVVIATLGFHIGPEVQTRSIFDGYNQEEEDQLLARCGWTEDGYRLFDISVFALSSRNGWFSPIAESNALFMRRALWAELGGLDERFQTPGGGLVNLDTFARAVQLPGAVVVTLLGEGTFHQIHGGVATNAVQSIHHIFASEYRSIRGAEFKIPDYRSLYFGSVPPNALASVCASARKEQTAAEAKRAARSS